MKSLFYNDPRINRASLLTNANTIQGNRIVDARTYLRSAVIPISLLNKRVAVYNGKTFFSFLVHKFMIGHKFGEFCMTKKRGPSIHARIIAKAKSKSKVTKK